MDDQEYLDNQQLLAGANQRANLHNTLAAVAAMSNNPAAAAAAKMAAADQQRQYSPTRLGNQGFMLPDTGAFVPSKIYKDEQQAAREEKRNALAASLAARADADAQREQGRADQRALLLTIAGMRSDDARYKVDNAPARAGAGGKPLPTKDLKDLASNAGLVETFNGLSDGFDDKYSSAGSTGVKNMLGKYQPLGIGAGYADQANWWQNYADQANAARKLLSGTAVTASEAANFDKANVTEGMSSTEIRRRLQQQKEAVARGHDKILKYYGDGGYNTGDLMPLGAAAATPGKLSSGRAGRDAASAVPSGVDPAVWAHMTPDQKALFK
jgi:hypothetical protein